MPCYDGMAEQYEEMKRLDMVRAVSKLSDMLCRLCTLRQMELKELPVDIAEWFAVHRAWDEIRKERGLDAPKCH